MKFVIYSPTIKIGVIEAPTWVDARKVAQQKYDEHVSVTKTEENLEVTLEVKWEGSDYTGKNEDRRHMLVREKKDGVWGEWGRI